MKKFATIVNKAKRYYRDAYRLDHFPSTFEAVFSGRPRLAYFGFLGDSNFGDELVYWAAKHLFANCTLIPVKRRSPLGILLASRNANRFFDGIVQGGGTLIGDSQWDDFQQKLFSAGLPVYVHGTGVFDRHPHPQWTSLSRNAFGGVRGPISASYMETTAGLPVVGDAALVLNDQPMRPTDDSRCKVLLNLGTHFHHQYEASGRVEAELRRFCHHVRDCDFVPAFLPLHPIDVHRGTLMREKVPELELLPQPKSLDEIQSHFEKATFAVGERLHFVISAAMLGCPFLSINYASKHRDFLASVNSEDAGLNPEEITLKRIVSAFDSRRSFDVSSLKSEMDGLQFRQRAEAERFLQAI